ncbi:MAG: hypothetical protein JWM02_1244 [Frankiales bacterium]|nr:hypothetical protein [Frankiales bacterium]
MLPATGSLTRLDAAVRAVSADRKAVLSAVDGVQVAATALDATDQVCATGRGVAARTAHGKASARTGQAALGLLAAQLPAYRSSLTSLGAASVAVDGAARRALLRVVTVGRAEADALEGFRVVAKRGWPQYVALDAAEDLWISRAVTSWYRTDAEAAAAYALLVEDQRPSLDAARARLGVAAAAVHAPITTESATLAAADRALASVRGTQSP